MRRLLFPVVARSVRISRKGRAEQTKPKPKLPRHRGSLCCVDCIIGTPRTMVGGFDVAGEIVAVGSGCKQFQVGDHVFAMADFTRRGTLAEYVAMEVSGEVEFLPLWINE